MKHNLFFLFLVVLANYVQAQTPLITNVSSRETISLDGSWHYIIDPYDNGYYNYRWQPFDQQENPGGAAYFTNTKPQSKSDRIEYDFEKASTLDVPGSWNFQRPELNYYEGSIWYQRDFKFDKSPSKRVFLYFGAANYETHVYVNGKKAGVHVGGFGPFNFDVTSLIKDGDNFIVVKVNNARKPEAVPTINTDWWNHGGLTRSVKLVVVPNQFIESYKLQLKPGSTDEIKGFVQLNSASQGEPISIQIPDLNLKKSFKSDIEGHVEFSFKVRNLKLWDTENPFLYNVVVTGATDEITDKIGFRSIEVRGTDILLNGKKIFLKGICAHEENPLSGTRLFSESEARMMYGWAKELNANFLRLAHYPHNEFMPRLADELGFLLWEEVPVYWTIKWKNEATLANARNQMKEVVTRDQNRASVIIWSVANETPVINDRLYFLKDLISYTRSMDDTRLVSAAMEVESDGLTKKVHDPLGEFTDVISFNQYHGWYGGDVADMLKMNWDIKYDKPVLISEFGAGAKYGFHGDYQTVWSEEFQERFYRLTLEGLSRVPNLSGFTPWILADFRSPRRPLTNIQDGWNRKGLIAEGGHKKKAFFVLQEYYLKR